VTCKIGFGGDVSEMGKYGAFQCNDSCDHNNHVAFMKRLVGNFQKVDGEWQEKPYPKSDKDTIKLVRKVFRAMAREFKRITPAKPLTMDEFIEALHGRDATIASQMGALGFKTKASNTALYEEQLAELKEEFPGLPSSSFPPVRYLKRYARIRNFAKVEMLNPEKFPRNISPRHPKFNLVNGCFIKPLEQFVNGITGVGNMREYYPGDCPYFKNHMIGKSYNKVQRGILLQNKIDWFIMRFGVHPLIIPTDCTGYDAHCTEDLINAEWDDFISQSYDLYEQYLKEVGELCTINRGTYGSAEWILRGGRMSGDMQTGCGNCWTIAAMKCAFFKWANKHRPGISKRWDTCIDGDDSLVFVHPDDLEFVQRELPLFFLRCGHEMKLDKVAHTIFDVEWCQSKYIRVRVEKDVLEQLINKKGMLYVHGEVPMAVQTPDKVFMSIGSHIHMREPISAWAYVVANCRAYATVYSGVPILGRLGEIGQSAVTAPLITSGLFHSLALGSLSQHYPSDNTLMDFCYAFGYTPAMVTAAEATIPSLNGFDGFRDAFLTSASKQN